MGNESQSAECETSGGNEVDEKQSHDPVSIIDYSIRMVQTL